ncbi:hypothetical protein SARC_11407 [Sphaeroforma arctica JP610]|uniref:Uncharacterized protein n=1 Tax=Sphaeroforma arctica JP610 TaxID=667725 RepID=A0A0L0FH44_9EUKA|nr:hypothetical protein SARC_11407 [Sphaeroforma arctica JP610]KNC76082.1 hypothetical protein SARC_11407 [Sphaeroforma arctica JP610]|eukprot:XP_014149984.1 hypothetical protein SARC_11407 [Sphaeroforma arctica JP610]
MQYFTAEHNDVAALAISGANGPKPSGPGTIGAPVSLATDSEWVDIMTRAESADDRQALQTFFVTEAALKPKFEDYYLGLWDSMLDDGVFPFAESIDNYESSMTHQVPNIADESDVWRLELLQTINRHESQQMAGITNDLTGKRVETDEDTALFYVPHINDVDCNLPFFCPPNIGHAVLYQDSSLTGLYQKAEKGPRGGNEKKIIKRSLANRNTLSINRTASATTAKDASKDASAQKKRKKHPAEKAEKVLVLLRAQPRLRAPLPVRLWEQSVLLPVPQ